MTIYYYDPIRRELEVREVSGETDTHWILLDGSHEPKSAWPWFKNLSDLKTYHLAKITDAWMNALSKCDSCQADYSFVKNMPE